MQVYDVILRDEVGTEVLRSNFEAADDEAALDLLDHYYADQRYELRHEGRVLARRTPVIGEATQ